MERADISSGASPNREMGAGESGMQFRVHVEITPDTACAPDMDSVVAMTVCPSEETWRECLGMAIASRNDHASENAAGRIIEIRGLRTQTPTICQPFRTFMPRFAPYRGYRGTR